MKTKAQNDLIRAESLVSQVKEGHADEVQKIYGSLCHKFPILVRTCGLCQAIAFSEDKATPSTPNEPKPRNTAHELLLTHIARILGFDTRAQLLQNVRDGDAVTYMLYTRRLLSSWVYFKRFAVSILKVPDAGAVDDTAQTGE